jgi:hypothetical protein
MDTHKTAIVYTTSQICIIWRKNAAVLFYTRFFFFIYLFIFVCKMLLFFIQILSNSLLIYTYHNFLYMISYIRQWVIFNPDSNKMFRVTKGVYYYL